MVISISDDQRRARLAVRHGLSGCLESVEEAARAMTCLHATDPASVYLAAWARSGAAREQVDTALYVDRTVVKQLAMRRTVFAFHRELLPAVWGSAAARVAAQQRRQLARDVVRAGLTEDGEHWVAEHTEAVRTALHERGPLTTAQLRTAVPALEQRLVISPGKAYGGSFPVAPRVLTALAASGLIVRGENDGGWKTSRPRWILTADWLAPTAPPLTPMSTEAGYAALLRSWLTTFGPGTETDIEWWFGAAKSAVRRALADVEAVEVELEGGVGYLLPDDLDVVPEPDPWAALLPVLDPTTMGWKQRDFYLGPHAARLFDSNGNAGSTAWWNGRIVGGWSQQSDGTVVVLPIGRLDRTARTALEERAAELTAWLAGDVVNSVYHSPLTREHRGTHG